MIKYEFSNIDIKRNDIREVVANKEIVLAYIPIESMMVDLLTKVLPFYAFKTHVVRMDMYWIA